MQYLLFIFLFAYTQHNEASFAQPHQKTSIVTDHDTLQWVDVRTLDSSILIDVRYASTNNFMKQKIYDCGRCFLRPEVARAVVAAQRNLKSKNLGIKLFDCYRPKSMQQKLWNMKPDARYVTPPSKGSMHSRGSAIDLTLVNEKGEELDMGTPYDFFGKEAHQTNTNLPKDVLNNRRILRETLAKHGFRHIRTEWWHYSYVKRQYPLSNMLWKCP